MSIRQGVSACGGPGITARVVLADDSPESRAVLRTLLEATGSFEVVGEATNGHEAVCLVRGLWPDLVILDVLMPGPSGIETLAELRRICPECRVVILSSFEVQEVAAATRTMPADLYVDKTTPPHRLLASLTALVGRSGAREVDDRSAREWSRVVMEEQTLFHALFRQAGTGLAVVTRAGQFIEVNRALCRTLGRPASALVGKSVLSMLHPADRAAADLTALMSGAGGGTTEPVPLRALHPDGRTQWLHVAASPVALPEDLTAGPGDEPSPDRGLVTVLEVVDVTDRRRAEPAGDEALLGALTQALPGTTVLVVDDRLRVGLASGHGLDEFCRPGAVLDGHALREAIHPDHWSTLHRACRAAVRGESGRLGLTRADGRLVSVRTVPVGAGGHGAVVVATDVAGADDGSRAFRAPQPFAWPDQDPLTGLLSRRRFQEELAGYESLTAGDGEGWALLIVGLDGFKEVNETHGHDVGDQVLRTVAATLQNRMRGGELLARLSGAEFAILLPRAGQARARAMAGDLASAVRAQRIVVNGRRIQVRASVGVAGGPAPGTAPPGTVPPVLARAGLDLKRAKAAGRDGRPPGAGPRPAG